MVKVYVYNDFKIGLLQIDNILSNNTISVDIPCYKLCTRISVFPWNDDS